MVMKVSQNALLHLTFALCLSQNTHNALQSGRNATLVVNYKHTRTEGTIYSSNPQQMLNDKKQNRSPSVYLSVQRLFTGQFVLQLVFEVVERRRLPLGAQVPAGKEHTPGSRY